jgi:hypothetical protein
MASNTQLIWVKSQEQFLKIRNDVARIGIVYPGACRPVGWVERSDTHRAPHGEDGSDPVGWAGGVFKHIGAFAGQTNKCDEL